MSIRAPCTILRVIYAVVDWVLARCTVESLVLETSSSVTTHAYDALHCAMRQCAYVALHMWVGHAEQVLVHCWLSGSSCASVLIRMACANWL